MAVEQSLQQFKETETAEPFSLQNSKLLKVELADVTIQAKLGSMVAYQGNVGFEHAGSGGVSRMIKKAVTSEGTDLMTPAITWSSGLSTSVKADVNVKTLIGRGSGETLQVSFAGTGWVLVQPSEGPVAGATRSGGGSSTGEGGVGGALGGILGR